jgi:glycerol-3-phosphate dehydrogenase
LIEEEGKSASELSRKDEIFVSDTGLISIAGGKLTGYRKMAERILDLLSEKFEEDYKIEVVEGKTDEIVLSGGPFKGSKEVNKYADGLAKKLGEVGIEPYYGQYLVSNYGKQSVAIIEQMAAYKDKDPLVRLGRAELWYTVHHEMVHTAMDFFNRRTGRLYFNLPTIEPLIKPIMKDLRGYFGWKRKRRQQEMEELEQSLRLAANFE